MRVVPALDEVEDGHASLGLSPETATVQKLALQGCEETLTHRVVEAIADRTGRRANASLAAAKAKRNGGVLAALVRVVDYFGRPSPPDRHVESLEDKFGPQVARHRPANYPSAPGIHHDGEIQEALSLLITSSASPNLRS